MYVLPSLFTSGNIAAGFFAITQIFEAIASKTTNQDPQITAELAKYQRSAVPFNVIWLPGKADPVILPELLTANIVLDALKKP